MIFTIGNSIVKNIWLLVFIVFPVVHVSAQFDKQAEQRYIQAGLRYIESEKYDSAIIQFNQLFHPDATADQKKRGQGYINLCKCLKAEQEGDYKQSLAFLQQVTDINWSIIHIDGISSLSDLAERIFNKSIQQLGKKETRQTAESKVDTVIIQKDTSTHRQVYLSIISSLILPGLGQWEAGHKIEGATTLVGEAILVGGALTTYFVGKNQMAKIKSGIDDYNKYEAACKKYDNLQTTNKVLWIASAVLYAFNIVRAATIQPLNHQDVAFQPSIIYTTSQPMPAIGLTYRF